MKKSFVEIAAYLSPGSTQGTRIVSSFFLVITDFGELDLYQAQAIVGVTIVVHNILILQAIFA